MSTCGKGYLVIIVMGRSHWAECHSVCFPNRNLGVRRANGSYSRSIRCILGAYWLFGYVRMHTERHSVAPKMCCACSNNVFIDHPNHPNVASMCIREEFGKHSGIRHVRKTFGKHASSSWCIRNENLEMLCSVCFPNAFRTQ